jgi:hypothetical protein
MVEDCDLGAIGRDVQHGTIVDQQGAHAFLLRIRRQNCAGLY